MSPSSFRDALIAAAFFGAAALAPFALGQTSISILILAFLFVVLCQAWNIVGGIAGQFCLGHSVFYAAGAYTSTLLYQNYGLSPWIGLLAGAMVAASLGAVMAWLSFRYALPPLSFALVTLALSQLAFLLLSTLDLVGASRGLSLPMRGSPAMFHFRGETSYYYVILAMAAVAYVVSASLYHAKLGIYFRCIRDNERAARAIGIDVLRYKIVAMMISAAFTAAAGTFHAQYLLYVDPRTFAGLHVVIEIILFTVVGGAGTIWGPILGPLLLVPLGETIRGHLSGQYPGLPLIVFGALLVIIIRFMPGGLASIPSRLLRQRPKDAQP